MDELKVFPVHIPRTFVGMGVTQNIGALAKGLGTKKALIVTDSVIPGIGLVDKIKASLEGEGIPYGIFDRCQPDAPTKVVEECSQVAKEGGYDLLIGVGGGSMMDTTKVASVLAVTGERTQDILGMDKVKKAGLAKILVPTTTGTGSEWSKAAVVTDAEGQKQVVYSDYLWADVAVIDPSLVMNLPPKITADTGMDSLSHAIEAYATWKSNVVSDMFAEKCIQLVSSNLRTAYAKGSKHAEARYNLAIAAGLGMQAVMCSAAGLVHSMNYPLAVKAHLTHGEAISLMLPYIMEFNLVATPAKFARIAQLMGKNIDGLSIMDAARKSVEAVRELSQDVSMPQKLSDVGIKEEDIPEFVDYLFKYQIYGMDNNPRDVTREDATKIFKAAF